MTAWRLVTFSAVCSVPGLIVLLAHFIGFSSSDRSNLLAIVLLLTGIAHVAAIYATSVLIFELVLHRVNTPEFLLLVPVSIIAVTAVILFLTFRFLATLFPTTLLGFLASISWVMSNPRRYADREIPRNISTVISTGLALILIESGVLVGFVNHWVELGPIV